jgi:hypothetical protein
LPDDFGQDPPLLKDGAELAAMGDLGLFGEAEVIDPAWAAWVGPAGGRKEEGAA